MSMVSPLLDDLNARVVALEERVCHAEEKVRVAETARDNAIAMRDEATTRKKQATSSAAVRITLLLDVIKELIEPLDADEKKKTEDAVAQILLKGKEQHPAGGDR